MYYLKKCTLLLLLHRLAVTYAKLSMGRFYCPLQAIGLISDDRANGAKPMETDAGSSKHRKRRRVGNHVYVGSTDLGYRREHMEVSAHAACAKLENMYFSSWKAHNVCAD